MYAFQSESTLSSCLNVKELLARNRCKILSLNDWNETRIHNHLVHKWTLNHLAKLVKWLSMIRTYSQMHHTHKYSPDSSIIWPVWLNGRVFIYKLSGCRFRSYCSHLNSRHYTCFEQGIPSGNYRVWIYSKCVLDRIRSYSQMHHTDKCSQHSSIIWLLWPNGWVFAYKLSGFGFASCCSHLIFRYYSCFKQGVPWHSGNYRVWIHSKTCIWHDKNIQSNAPYR